MTDTRIAESFLTNVKIDGTTSEALRVYVMSLVWCNANGTDGDIPTTALRLLHPDGRRDDLIAELVDRQLWHPTKTGWQIHDFLKYQMPAAQVERARELTRERKRRHREKQQTQALDQLVTRDKPRDGTSDSTRDGTRGLTGQDRDRTGRSEGSESQPNTEPSTNGLDAWERARSWLPAGRFRETPRGVEVAGVGLRWTHGQVLTALLLVMACLSTPCQPSGRSR